MSTVVVITGGVPAETAGALLSVVGHRISYSGHVIVPLAPGTLPTGAPSAADRSDPDVERAVAALDAAAGVVVLSPAFQVGAGPVGTFLDLLPAGALRGTAVLLLASGTATPGPTADHALLRSLDRLSPGAVARGCFVPEAHLHTYPGGGVVLDAASALPLAQATDAFLASFGQQAPATPLPPPTGRVSPVAGAPDLTVVRAEVDDPVLAPLLRDLMIEYTTRYGGPSPYTTLTEVPPSDFSGPDGAFLALTQDGETIAGGALRRYDEQTAEVKRVWTSARHRRRGLALRLMAELEAAAGELGYRRIHLTTGRRQPEAVALYLAAGYLPRFDVTAELGDAGPLAFGKELVPGAGPVDWVDPPGDEYYRTGDAAAREGSRLA